MNGIQSRLSKALVPLLALLMIQTAQAFDVWPDMVRPPIELPEALELAMPKVTAKETDDVYCINATLLNGEGGDESQGFWAIGFMTELGNSYSAAVRMDGRVSVKKVKRFQINTNNSWPDTITPPVSVYQALNKAVGVLAKKSKTQHYCLNASLVSGSNDVVSDGMWNFVFQTTNDDPYLINIRMNGKTKTKRISKLKEHVQE